MTDRAQPLLHELPRRPTVVRRLPVPLSEPPYDPPFADVPETWSPGRSTGSENAVQGALALSFVLPSGVPAVPQPPPDLRLVRRGPDPTGGQGVAEVWAEPQLTPRSALPDPAGWAARLAQAVVEVVGGERPLAQLVRWTSVEVYDLLRHGAGAVPGNPLRAVVRSITVSEPVDGVAEVAALVRRGQRCTALALRLEGLDGRWLCTALELT